MDIRQLKQILTVADCGSILAAAEKLYISRPAVSKSIARAEEEIGIPLFERRPDGIRLTEAGCQLLPQIRAAVESFEKLEQQVSDLGHQRTTVRIGFTYGTNPFFIQKLMQFQTQHSNIQVEISHILYDDIVHLVKSGQLHIVCSGIHFNDSDLFQYPVARDEIVWGVRSDSPIAEKGYITQEEKPSPRFWEMSVQCTKKWLTKPARLLLQEVFPPIN